MFINFLKRSNYLVVLFFGKPGIESFAEADFNSLVLTVLID